MKVVRRVPIHNPRRNCVRIAGLWQDPLALHLGYHTYPSGSGILFRPCLLLVQDLLAAKRPLTLDRLRKRLRKYDAIILDYIGYVRHNREKMEVLFTLLVHTSEAA